MVWEGKEPYPIFSNGTLIPNSALLFILLWSKVVHFTENRGWNHAIWDETYETANCIFNSDSNPTMATQTEAVNLNELALSILRRTLKMKINSATLKYPDEGICRNTLVLTITYEFFKHTSISTTELLNMFSPSFCCACTLVWKHSTTLFLSISFLQPSTHLLFSFCLPPSQVGKWHSEHGLSMESDINLLIMAGTMFNTTLTITTILVSAASFFATLFQRLQGCIH